MGSDVQKRMQYIMRGCLSELRNIAKTLLHGFVRKRRAKMMYDCETHKDSGYDHTIQNKLQHYARLTYLRYLSEMLHSKSREILTSRSENTNEKGIHQSQGMSNFYKTHSSPARSPKAPKFSGDPPTIRTAQVTGLSGSRQQTKTCAKKAFFPSFPTGENKSTRA